MTKKFLIRSLAICLFIFVVADLLSAYLLGNQPVCGFSGQYDGTLSCSFGGRLLQLAPGFLAIIAALWLLVLAAKFFLIRRKS